MKLGEMKMEITAIIAVVLALGGFFGYKHFAKAHDDNAVEETAEHIIKSQTGIDVDLTPDSPEQ